MTEFEEWFQKYKQEEGITFDTTDKAIEGYCKKAWNAAVQAVDNNITYRNPQLDQDIRQIYTHDDS